jgi:hypothetical protein
MYGVTGGFVMTLETANSISVCPDRFRADNFVSVRGQGDQSSACRAQGILLYCIELS